MTYCSSSTRAASTHACQKLINYTDPWRKYNVFEYLQFSFTIFFFDFFHNLHIFINYMLSSGCQKLVSCSLLVVVGTQLSVNKVLIFCVLQGFPM
jgi:hypothetical protein